MRKKVNKIESERLSKIMDNIEYHERQQQNKMNIINNDIKRYNETHNQDDLEFINFMIEQLKLDDIMFKKSIKLGYIK